MHRVLFIAAAGFLIAVFGCGDDDGPGATPQNLKEVRVDVGAVPEADREDAAAVLEARAEAYLGTDAAAEVDDDTILLSLAEPINDLRLLEIRGQLEFREPVLEAQPRLVCIGEDGEEFQVLPSKLIQGLDSEGQPVLTCVGDDAMAGEVKWAAAIIEVDGSDLRLTGDRLVRDSITIVERPVLQVELSFDEPGTAAFSELTGRLVGFPLAVFMDGRLLTAPTVLAQIDDGKVAISGFTDETVRLSAAILMGGELPAGVRIIAD